MLRDIERILIQVFFADDPEAELRNALARETGLAPDDRGALSGIEGDGLRIASLLVKKLRFQRLTAGDGDLARLFEERPDKFLRLRRAYTAAVALEAYFPSDEALPFRPWREAR